LFYLQAAADAQL